MGKRGRPAKVDRNARIRRRVEGGEPMVGVAEDYGISRQRVEQIVHPRRHIARKRVQKNGAIPQGAACERCGDEATERHHPDYNRPLLIQYLCNPCHRTADREQREGRAREGLGVPTWQDIESMREAQERIGTSHTWVREGVESGVLLSATEGATTFVVPAEVDAWIVFLRERSEVRRELGQSNECGQGHRYFPWNTALNPGGSRRCKACNSENVRRIDGGYQTDFPTQYEVGEALYDMGFREIRSESLKVFAHHPNVGSVKISRGGTSPWIIRVDGTEIARAGTLDELHTAFGFRFQNIAQPEAA